MCFSTAEDDCRNGRNVLKIHQDFNHVSLFGNFTNQIGIIDGITMV